MAGNSNIEWTEATWNPIAGCKIVSPGCTNCYAMRMAARLQAMDMKKYAGTTRKSGRRHIWTGRVNIDADALSAPLRWRKPQRIFVNSMSDSIPGKRRREIHPADLAGDGTCSLAFVSDFDEAPRANASSALQGRFPDA
jgi:protein gp37